MLLAAKTVADMGGGLAVVADGKVLASLALPIAGLMSDQPVALVHRKISDLIATAHKLGCGLANPFMALSFLSLPVIPELKLTDLGLVDVNKFDLVDIFMPIENTSKPTNSPILRLTKPQQLLIPDHKNPQQSSVYLL